MVRNMFSGGGLRTPAIAALLAGCIAAVWNPPPVDAQGLRVLQGTMGRPIVGMGQRIAASRHFRVHPRLGIVRARAGSVTGLYPDRDHSLLFVVLGDGTARLWDLERGVQLGGAIGGGIVTAAVRGAGRSAEVIAVRRDGSSLMFHPDGTWRTFGAAIEGIDPAAVPVVSGDGGTMAFRASDARWYVRTASGGRIELPDAAPDASPTLSRDGSTLVYRATGGTMVAGRLLSRGIGLLGFPDGCARGTQVTAGVFAPDGERVVFGDALGNVCAWMLAGVADPVRTFVLRRALPGPVHMLAPGRHGGRIAAGTPDGTIGVWSVSGRLEPIASLKLEASASRPLALDVRRGWGLTGEGNGTVGVYSLRAQAPIGRLISTTDGWAVLDARGRFDGSEPGIDALVWAGETLAQTLPVDAFSEGYFEPGLLAKLDELPSSLVNETVDDLPREGYVRPPAVEIEPIDVAAPDAGARVSITVRWESGYPQALLSEIRLYHNGKLAGQATPGTTGRAVRFQVRLSPGDNTFRALAVGPAGIEGRPATAVVEVDATPSPPRMQVVAIGINDYLRPDFELLYAHNDAVSIASALSEQQRGRHFGEVEAVSLLDANARTRTIEEHLLERSLSPRDVLVVYFSGHGYALREENGWEWYLLPFTDAWNDRTTSRREFEAMVRRHGLASRRLMHLLMKSQAQRVFLVLDSCRSGTVVETMTLHGERAVDDAAGQKALRRVARVGGIHVLAASRAREDAVELQLTPHGALTYLVLEAIRGKADGNGDRAVSVREIIAYAGREMPYLARRLVQEPISQKPVGYSRGVDFALAGW